MQHELLEKLYFPEIVSKYTIFDVKIVQYFT